MAGKGIPCHLSTVNHGITQIPISELPTLDEAVTDYERGGGSLTRDSKFGFDPLRTNPDLLLRRDRLFRENYPSFEELFTAAVSDNYYVFEASIEGFKNITFRLLDLVT